MSFVDYYTPPAAPTEVPDPYDINFDFPLHNETLESARVRLTPFIPALHAKAYWEGIKSHLNEVYRYMVIKDPSNVEEFLAYMERYYRSNPEFILFAIIDKTRPDDTHPGFGGGSLAGIIALLRVSAIHLSTEIGYVVVLPAFQRTHVATNACGILLGYCLQLPSASPPGLGLRRVQWTAHSENEASKRLAKRVGFREEGILRWTMVMPDERALEGSRPREDDALFPRGGVHSSAFSVCWDDWENGGRELAKAAIDR